MNFKIKRFFCAIIILLVISLTPVSAVQISNTTNDNQSETLKNSLDSFKSDMDHVMTISDQMKTHLDRIKDDQDYIVSNWYRFWKWGQVSNSIEDIKNELDAMKVPSEDLKATSDRISKDLDELKAINNSYNGSSDFESIDSDSYANAHSIALLLKAKNVTVEISKPTNFKEGDIVQYHDEGKYYRYLKYNGIDNKTNYVKLQDRNRNILISQDNFNQTATLKISSPDNKELLNPVNNVLEYQLKTLNETYDEKLNESKSLDQRISDASVLVKYLLIGGAVGFVIAAIISALSSWKALIIYTLSVVTVITMMSTCVLVLTFLKEKNDDSMHDIFEKKTNLYECIYGDPHSYPVAEDYNLTSSVNKAIYGHIECKEYDYVFDHFVLYNKVTEPEHGSLNLTQYGQYVYTPDANYTGTDSFKYRVNDGLVDSNIAEVHVNISKNSTHLDIWNSTMGNELCLIATLTDDNDRTIANKTIQFIFNGTQLGNATTNGEGRACLIIPFLPSYAQFSIQALFMGDPIYIESNATTNKPEFYN